MYYRLVVAYYNQCNYEKQENAVLTKSGQQKVGRYDVENCNDKRPELCLRFRRIQHTFVVDCIELQQ
jgi:hypothetical protein